MTDGDRYLFADPAHWARCLTIATAERSDLRFDDGVEIAGWPGPVGGFAVGPDDGLLWVGADGSLRGSGDCAGPVLGAVARVVPGRRVTWVLDNTGLHRFDAATLQRLGDVDLPDLRDIAGDGHDGLWALTDATAEHIDAAGRIVASRKVEPQADAIAASRTTIALLYHAAKKLVLRDDPKPALTVELAAIFGSGGPLFEAHGLASAPGGFYLHGTWGDEPGYLFLDSAGEPGRWGTWTNATPAATAPSGDDLIAVFDTGATWSVRRFPGAATNDGTLWLTPVLESDTLAGKWLLADLRAILPEGATLQLRWAASKDPAMRDVAVAMAADETKLKGARIRGIETMLDWSSWRSFVGEPREGDPQVEDFSFPLADGAGCFLWIEIRLDRNDLSGGDAVAPRLDRLGVVHDEPGLIDHLPAVYRGPEGDQDGTLARLLGVFEAVSRGIDREIGALADRLDPARTDSQWLGDLAMLLGLPFDATLSAERQRAIVTAAPAILAGRGTRRGVLALLAAALGDRDYRVIDRSAEFAAVTLGGGGLAGSRLPGLLTGPSMRTPQLNARLVLGRTPLCPVEPGRELVTRGPELFVEIPATGRERLRVGAAIERMVGELVPAGVQPRFRWIDRRAATGGDVLAVADGLGPLALGDPRPLGAVRLGGDDHLKLGERGMPIAGALP